MAAAMGIELLTEEQYRELQTLGNFDTKTSSWVKADGPEFSTFFSTELLKISTTGQSLG